MEDVLRLYARLHDRAQPVVCLDERPVVLRGHARKGRPMRPGKPARIDYEYERKGTATIFCIVEPKTGRRLTHATAKRAGADFARAPADRSPLPASPPDPPRPRQSQHALVEVPRRRAGASRGSASLASLRNALHAQARQLAQCRRAGGQPRLARMPRPPPHRQPAAAHWRGLRVEPVCRSRPALNRVEVPPHPRGCRASAAGPTPAPLRVAGPVVRSSCLDTVPAGEQLRAQARRTYWKIMRAASASGRVMSPPCPPAHRAPSAARWSRGTSWDPWRRASSPAIPAPSWR